MKSAFKTETFGRKYLPWLLLLLGILLRVAYLGVIPGGYHRDEAYGAWNALSLYLDGIDSAGYSYPVYFEAWAHGQNALNSYLMLPLIALAGGHVTPLVVRLPQVIVSIATLIAIYWLMRELYSLRTANWALFLAAICPWHVMMSRWGLESNLAPGFLMLGLCFWVLGLKRPKLLPVSALCYGLSLYSYATIWPVVPLIVLLQFVCCTAHGQFRPSGKRHFGSWLLLSGLILVVMGLPLVLFLFVNAGYLPDLKIGCFSIYRMTQFRSNELAHSLSQVWANIRNLGYLLLHQDVGRPYDVIMPYGFFYDIGRFLAVVGAAVVVVRTVISLIRKQFDTDFFIFIQLIGAGVVGCLLTVNMTQINCLYLPLVLCEAIGAESLCSWVGRRMKGLVGAVIVVIFLVNLAGFQYEYYTEYRTLASAHFQEGADDAVRYAWEQAERLGVDVSVNAGLKYPNVLLAMETGAEEYLQTAVVSDDPPAPSCFSCKGVTFYMGFDLQELVQDRVYILYYTETEAFADYELTQFFDWYVAVPRTH